MTHPEHLEEGVIHIHETAEILRLVEMLHCIKGECLYSIHHRLTDLWIFRLEICNLLDHSRGRMRYLAVPDNQVIILGCQPFT